MVQTRMLVLAMAFSLLFAACGGNEYGDDDIGDDDDDSAVGDDDDSAVGDDDTAGAAPEIFVDPSMLVYSVCNGQASSTTIHIANVGDAPLIINGMACPLPQITFTPFKGAIDPSASPVDVDVIAACTEEGFFGQSLKIMSNDPNRPQYNVQVELTCDPPC